jgi:hypothetical protein
MNDYVFERDLPDGRHCDVIDLTYGRARLLIAPDRSHTGVDDSY